MLDQAFDGLQDQVGADFHQLVVQLAGRLVRPDAALLPQDDAAGVDVLVDHERGHARHLLAVDDGPVDRGGAAVLREQRRVEVEGAEFRHRPDFFREHPEGHHDEQVGLPGAQRLEEFRVLELDRLEHGDAVRHGVLLDGALVDLEAAAGGLVGDGHHADDLVAGLDEGVERLDREFGRAHINDARRAEQAGDAAHEHPPPGLELIHIEKFCVPQRPPGEEGADRGDHGAGDEDADGRLDGAVTRQLAAGYVDDVIKDEEEHGDDQSHAEAALLAAHQRAHRRPDEEQQETGEAGGELLQVGQVGLPEVVALVVGIETEVADLRAELRHVVGGPVPGLRLLVRALPAQEVRRAEIRAGRIAEGRVQLAGHHQRGMVPDDRVVAPVERVQVGAQRIAQMQELARLLGLGRVVETGGVGLLEVVVLQRDEELLPVEVDVLQDQRRVVVAQGVVFAVGGSVEEGEGQVFLAPGHLEDGGVGHRHGDVALAGGVVVDLDVVEHPARLVLVADPEDIALDAVVEGPRRDLDLVLGAGDVVAQGVDLVEGVRHEPRADHIGAAADQQHEHAQRQEDAPERDAGSADGHQLAALAELTDGHRGGEQGRERQGERQGQAAHAPEQEFQDRADAQALADQLVDVEPEGLHHQDEDYDEEDRNERSDKRLQYEAVEFLHPGGGSA